MQESQDEQTSNFEGRTSRDAHLSLRHETRHLWKPLQELIPGLTEAGAAIAIALRNEAITGGRDVSYSRTGSHYEDRHESIYTLKRVKGGVEQLDAAGLLSDHFRQRPGVRGRQSTCRASDKLIKLVNDTLGPRARLVPRRPRSAVQIRDAAGETMALPDTRAIQRQVARVERINEAMRGTDISHGAAACYTRIYHGSMDRGGRFYADGQSWQNLRKTRRSEIQIDGEATIEIDYVAMHPSLVYADAGMSMPADPYIISAWPRKVVKVAFLILLNAGSLRGAIGALSNDEAMKEADVVPGTPHAAKVAAQVISDVKKAHPAITKAFHSDAGAGLMKRDSDMAEKVMLRLLDRGILALAIHDSFIVQQSKAGDLQEVMMAVANDHGLPNLAVKIG